jgi:hypothetical protein
MLRLEELDQPIVRMASNLYLHKMCDSQENYRMPQSLNSAGRQSSQFD